MAVPILVSCSCVEEHKRKMSVQCNIPLAELVTKVEAEFPCCQGIELKKKIDENNWVLLKDPLDLGDKPKLKAEKVSASKQAGSMRAVVSKCTLWLERNGDICENIKVYFYPPDPPLTLRFKGGPVTPELVMVLLKAWKCDDVQDKDGRQIGGHVPGFQLVEDREKADVRVKFAEGGSRSELGTDALKCTNYDEPTLVLDINSSNEARIQFNILHEFGHVLSLYHEQQHPDYIKVMDKFLDRDKRIKQFRKDNPKLTEEDFNLQNGKLPDGIFTSEYDPDSIMHYPTYLDTIKEEYKDKIKTSTTVDTMKEQGEIDEREHRVLRGFIQRLDHNTSKPSDLDKFKVAQAYYNEWRKANPEASPPPVDPDPELHSPEPNDHKIITNPQSLSPEPGTYKIRTTYQGKKCPAMSDLAVMKLHGEMFKFLPKLSEDYKDIANVLKLEQYQKDTIEREDYKDRITGVFKHWDRNASGLAGGYPHTWQGLWEILDDSGLTEKGKAFFEYLERHER